MKRRRIQTRRETNTGIGSVQCRLVSDSLIQWLHCTGIEMGFTLQMPALAHLVGASVGTVSLKPVGWVGFGIDLLTPNTECIAPSFHV